MHALIDRIPGKLLAVGAALIVAAAALLIVTGGKDEKTVTANFSRVVSIYPGSEVRIMGVRVGEVTAVVPQGKTVRVSMKYDAQYQVPADAKAAIITPTLVADRYVQLAPAYADGPVMKDDAVIPLDETATPVELDRIYRSLSDLTTALGKNGVNKDGTLNKVLSSGAKALGGKGELANETILNLADATHTFGENSDPLFRSVTQMAQFTNTLAENDAAVNSFMVDLTGVSSQLAGEKKDLERVLVSLAKALRVVRTFVKDNKKALKEDLRELTGVLGALAKEKDALATILEKGPLGMGNLALAFDTTSGSIGARVQVGPNVADFDGFLCGVVANAGVRNSKAICALLKQIIEPLGLGLPDLGAGVKQAPIIGDKVPAGSLNGLLGGGR